MRRLLRFVSLFAIVLTVMGLLAVRHVEAQSESNPSQIARNQTTIVVRNAVSIPVVAVDRLPPEARSTISLIRRGGPFPYAKDGTVFGNRERRLPQAITGYYREYTVKTPGGTRSGGTTHRYGATGRNLLYWRPLRKLCEGAMTMDNLIAMLDGNRSPGLYTLETTISSDALAALTQKHGARLFYLDGTTITSKADFLQAVANAMAFPRHFGQNWDALEDCLTDLDWLNGDRFVLLYEQPDRFAQADPSEWQVALDILRSTVAYWSTKKRPVYILFQGSNTDLVGLDTL